MANTSSKKKTSSKPVRRYKVNNSKKKSPKPVRRYKVNNSKKKSPKPVRRYKVNNSKKTTSSRRKPSRPVSRRPAGSTTRKTRVRPSVRAAQRKQSQQNQTRPKPTVKSRTRSKPSSRRRVVRRAATAGAVGTAAVAATAANRGASAEIQAKMSRIEDKYARLETQAQLGGVYDAIGRIDTELTELPFDLEALRDRGYVHSGQLEDKLGAMADKWDDVRPRVESNLKRQVERVDKELVQAGNMVNRMSANKASSIRAADTAVNSLERRINAARSAVDSLYDGIEDELAAIESQLRAVEEIFELLDGSPDIQLRDAEGPLLCVKTRWHRDGKKEGPEGYLFLTDQRLIFEQREEVVTKKHFGLFKADSEMVQEVHVDVDVHQIEDIKHKEEGGFLGMGKDDIIEFVFAATADYSRARFHLQGQNSSEWAATIKRIQTGDIDEDRSDAYVDELEEAGIVSASFPTECSNCYAAIPEQPRGVTSYTCEFCGTVTMPES